MQSIGERLEEARKRKGVTIREAAEATKIRGEYLNHFENNNFAINLPDIYVRGFLRSYSAFLKVDGEKIITDYSTVLIGEAKSAKKEHREFFGRMELQQPLVADAASNTPETKTDGGHEDRSEERSGGFLANIDKEIAIKGGIIAIIAILSIVVLVWIFTKITGNSETPAADTPAGNSTSLVPSSAETPTSSVETEIIRLFATGDVRVSVTERNTGKVLLNLHPMSAGQSVEVSRQGPVRIDYTAGEYLEVEVRGTRYGTNKTGANYSTIR